MSFLQSLIENSTIPFVTAFLLGLLTAISPCPLATNITAIGYISKNLDNKNSVFINGLLYTLGGIITYTLISLILIPLLREGTSMYSVQKFISKYGGMLIPPILIIFGILTLDIVKIKIPKLEIGGNKLKNKTGLGALVLGFLFAFAFCPTSALLYFGMLIPLSATESGGYILPVIFAFATGIPVIIVAWILAYSMAGLGKFYNQMQIIEKWFRRVVSLLFILVGIYYASIYYF